MNWFKKKVKLQIGQVWAAKDLNPFSRSEYENEIIDIKDGYFLSKSYVAQ